jgi:phosphatidylserine decarboxylase
MRLELAWGSVRRSLLKRLRPGYVAAMGAKRRGSGGDYPHEILDPRDLKYYRNQGDWHWAAEDDRFRWRDHLGFARVGLAELLVWGGGSLLLAVALAFWYWPLAIPPALVALEVIWFFRNPRRTIPAEPGQVVSPADGRVVAIEEVDFDEYIGGPAVTIGIFLSVFNVHINRAPLACRVVGMRYRPGKYLNAMRPESSRENESLELLLEEPHPPYRGFKVRQITGAIARRIVCWVRPDDRLDRGQQFGMIKLGSRTEITLPRAEGWQVLVRCGDRVRAGSSLIARYDSSVPPKDAAVTEQE